MKIIQINTSINTGSTGRITEDIGKLLLNTGHESYIAAGNTTRPSSSQVIEIGDKWDKRMHGLKTRLFDRHGFGSENATLQFIKEIIRIQPDIIHLHNIHGYYLHIGVLFDYLKQVQTPVVWTFHDCWPFTGHCSFFDRVNCYKWQTACHHCPNLKGYPKSLGFDNSRKNYNEKSKIFNGLENCTIITPSEWLANHVKSSFLRNYQIQCIHNGVDIKTFSPSAESNSIKSKYQIRNTPYILGVANTWDLRKGLKDFEALVHLNDDSYQIVLVGLSNKQIKSLHHNIIGIERTENIFELAALYAGAGAFVNPTYVDNFPTTNLEALACGTPVIMYNTGGSPEAINENTGIVVEKGNITELKNAIEFILSKGKEFYRLPCIERVKKFFNKEDSSNNYIELYKKMLVQ